MKPQKDQKIMFVLTLFISIVILMSISPAFTASTQAKEIGGIECHHYDPFDDWREYIPWWYHHQIMGLVTDDTPWPFTHGIEGVTIYLYNGENELTLVTDAMGYFDTEEYQGFLGCYGVTVIPSKPGYTFIPPSYWFDQYPPAQHYAYFIGMPE